MHYVRKAQDKLRENLGAWECITLSMRDLPSPICTRKSPLPQTSDVPVSQSGTNNHYVQSRSRERGEGG
jgi:hypothetical protein